MYIVLFVVAIIVILWFYVKLQSGKKAAGLEGWVRSQDLDGKSRRIYRNYAVGISAKPDIVEGGGSGKVTEYKSAAIGDKARRTDIVQLTAEMMATGAKKAELRYGNGKRFQFTKDSSIIKSSMKRIAWISEQMNWHLQTGSTPRGTPRPSKCAKCWYRKECSIDNKAA